MINRFKEWLQQKRKTESINRALEVEKNKLRELELKEKKEKSDQAFANWLQHISMRQKTKACTYVTCDGMLKGIVDQQSSLC